MKHINEKKQWAQLVFVLIPLTLSLVFYYFDNILILTAAVLSLFLLVSILPVCKKRENLWMFIFSGISLFPANIRSALLLFDRLKDEIYMDSDFLKVTAVLFLLHIFFCIEQLALGILTRLVWRKQYKVEVE